VSTVNPYQPSPIPDASIVEPGAIQNVKIEIGDIFNYAFKIWKENLGQLVCGALILVGVGLGFGLISNVVDIVLRGGAEGKPNLTSVVVSGVISILNNLVSTFLSIGLVKFHLAMLRRQPADLGMIFSGGDRFLPIVGVSILFGLAVFAGLLLLIIPGIIISLFYWPCYFLVIDRQTPVMQSFSLARTITKNNELTSFVVGLLAMGVVILGVCALCIGILFAQPLAALLGGCAYLMMSGQLDPKSANLPDPRYV
jgi:hypothetical protein